MPKETKVHRRSYSLLVEDKTHPLWKTIWDDLEKPNIHRVDGPAMPLLDTPPNPKETRACAPTDMHRDDVPSSTVHKNKRLETPITIPRCANKW